MPFTDDGAARRLSGRYCPFERVSTAVSQVRATTPASGIHEGSPVNASEPEPPDPLTLLLLNVPLPPEDPELLLVAGPEPPWFPDWLLPPPLPPARFPPLEPGLVAAGERVEELALRTRRTAATEGPAAFLVRV